MVRDAEDPPWRPLLQVGQPDALTTRPLGVPASGHLPPGGVGAGRRGGVGLPALPGQCPGRRGDPAHGHPRRAVAAVAGAPVTGTDRRHRSPHPAPRTGGEPGSATNSPGWRTSIPTQRSTPHADVHRHHHEIALVRRRLAELEQPGRLHRGRPATAATARYHIGRRHHRINIPTIDERKITNDLPHYNSDQPRPGSHCDGGGTPRTATGVESQEGRRRRSQLRTVG